MHTKSNTSMNMTANSQDKNFKMNQNKSFYNKYTKIFPNTLEFNQLEYQLQMKLQSCNVKIDQIYSVKNESMAHTFNKHTGLTLDSWIFTDDLDSDNKIQDVLKNSRFDFKDKGKLFSSGILQAENKVNIDGDQTLDILVSTIAPGKSQVKKIFYNEDHKDQLEQIRQQKPDEPFQSYIIQRHKGPEGAPDDHEDNKQNQFNYDEEYEHEDNTSYQYIYDYILFDETAVFPKYVIRVVLNKDSLMGVKNRICDNCKKPDSIATVYCYNDKAYFCDSCDFNEHEPNQTTSIKNKDNQKKFQRMTEFHRREPLANRPMIFSPCTFHTDSICELYCSTCKKAICVYCKIDGDHSQVTTDQHKLRKLEDQYKDAILESEVVNPELESRRSHLQKVLKDIDLKIVDIQQNSNQIIEEIYLKHLEALDQLKQVTHQKIQQLVSEQMEVNRQVDQLEYAEAFLKMQLEQLDPIDYLKNWVRHSEYRKDIIEEQNKMDLNYGRIKADIQAKGKIDVDSKMNINSINYKFQQIDNSGLNQPNFQQQYEDFNNQSQPQFNNNSMFRQNLNVNSKNISSFDKSQTFKTMDPNNPLLSNNPNANFQGASKVFNQGSGKSNLVKQSTQGFVEQTKVSRQVGFTFDNQD